MAHRLPPAGVCTPQSEHYVNYFVIPKPTQMSLSCEEQMSSCSIRPNFLCQAPVQSVKCVNLHAPPCPACPLAVGCGFKSPCHQVNKCCQPRTCLCCCTRREVNIVRSACCCPVSECCCNQDCPCAISITLPRSEDQVIEEKMKKKLKKLKTDVQKFDEALACLETKNIKTVQHHVIDRCKPRCCCCCCCHKPMPARQLCFVPAVCGQKPICGNCRPFYGKKKSAFEKLKLK